MAILLSVTRSCQMHLRMQTGVNDVIVETLLQRRIPPDGGKVPQGGFERRRRYGFLPSPRKGGHVASKSVAAAMVLNGLEETYAAALPRATTVRAIVHCGIDGDAEIGPGEGGSTPLQQTTAATNAAQGVRRTSTSTPHPAPSRCSAQHTRMSRCSAQHTHMSHCSAQHTRMSRCSAQHAHMPPRRRQHALSDSE